MARRVDPERTALRRAEITRAAAGLFGSRGYDRTTAADIGRAAGISSASVFYYFADKQAVFRSIFEEDLPAVRMLVERHACDPSPLAAILAIVEDQVAPAADRVAPGLLVELLRTVDRDAELAAVVVETAAVLGAGLAAQIRRGALAGEIVDDLAGDRAAETAVWIQALIDSAFLTAVPGRDPRPAVRRIVAAYLTTPDPTDPERSSP